MTARSILAATAAIFVSAAFAPHAGAQSMSTLTHAKQSASNAVAATNEHTAREQMVGSTAGAHPNDVPAKAAKPSGTAKTAANTPANTAANTAAKTAAKTAAPTAAKPGDTPEKGQTAEITLMRESFTYDAGGRRDPFVSLIANGDLRPMISDLRLVTVIYAPQGRSVAVMRDVSTDEQYRVTSGQTLGRMRVASISPKAVTFTIEEYGFSRQEVLALNDTTNARSQ